MNNIFEQALHQGKYTSGASVDICASLVISEMQIKATIYYHSKSWPHQAL